MGQKVNPLSFRLGLIQCWDSKTFIDHFNYSTILQQDIYIQEYVKGVLNSFKIFFTRCIIKRLNTKTFILIYYYRRPFFNYKSFINFNILNKRVKKFQKLKNLNYNLTKASIKQTSNLINFNSFKTFKIRYISNTLPELFKDKTNNILLNNKVKKILFYNKNVRGLYALLSDSSNKLVLLWSLRKEKISIKFFNYLFWMNLIQLQKLLKNVTFFTKLNRNLFNIFVTKTSLKFYLKKVLNKLKVSNKSVSLNTNNDFSTKTSFSLKKIIKYSLSKVLNSREIYVSLINVGKYNTFKLKNKRSRISKLNNMSRMLKFGFSKKFNILTINLFQKAFKYKNVKVLSYFLAYLFKKNIRKPRVFFRFIDIVSGYFYTFYKLEGLQIAFKGRINGAKRSRTIILQKGNLPLNTLNTNIVYSFSNVYTFYGVYGVKIWLYF